MPTTEELRGLVGRAEITKLKMLGTGLEVDRVLGRRVLIKEVEPETIMDRLEKEAVLVFTAQLKKDNTPRASTGIVVKVGEAYAGLGMSPVEEGEMILFSKYAGVSFSVDEESGYRIIDENEIICTFKRAEKSDVMVLPVKAEG